MNGGALAGLRILDLTSVVVGPTCTWRLAQYGAEVIKVEAPEGDLMRGLGGLSPTGQHSGTYLHLNRAKRNICLDLKKPGTPAVMERLVASADVVVANMRPRALERCGLDAATVRARHPDKIHCLITGYGTDGPYAGRPTYDSVVQGASGIAGLFLGRDGAPSYVPMVVCDHVVGEIAAGAILAAIVRRNAGGGGATIEIPMFETMAAFVLQEHLAQHSFDPPVGQEGDQRLLNPMNKPLRTADGWISVTINTDPQVRAFLKAVGREDLLSDPRFATVAARARNVKEWFEIRGAGLSGKSSAEWLEIFGAADIAAMPCHTLETLRQDSHLQEVGLISSEQHPTEGRVSAIRSTIRTDGTYAPLGEVAQPRGWESQRLLEELGFSSDEIEELLASGAAVPTPAK
ncbi:CoA transferase [Roseomonas gilardii]|uniref:CoA transferase n=1 Tax=Roseomonas gilardii TaxID=257708 RepID=A0ABU3MIQ2_9PROT|nr:CoA transferase [Roseomonas gilardii]MDT8332888.1 CoA transferase [Roseomonas gilardii]